MKVIYTKKHRLHEPQYIISAGEKEPHPEKPLRVENIFNLLAKAGFTMAEPRYYNHDIIQSVHSADYVNYLSDAYQAWTEAQLPPEGVIPDTFPFRITGRKPATPLGKAGWYCFDTCAPIVKGTFEAAVASAYCALSGADFLLEGESLAYALCRPPGHHAGIDYCGGFCYFNNAALASAYLLNEKTGRSESCKIALLDTDYHHGNGTQQIFYESDKVLFISLHADPEFEFPFYWGFADEIGTGEGTGYNINIPLPAETEELAYLEAVDRAVSEIAEFSADFLVVSFGTDTLDEDPVGLFKLSTDTFAKIGQRIARLGLPILVVQEGGYDIGNAGRCVSNFLSSLESGKQRSLEAIIKCS